MRADDPNKAARKRQLLIGGAAIGFVVLALGVVMATEDPGPRRAAPSKEPSAVLVDPKRDIKPEQEWITRATRQLREMEERLKKMELERDQLTGKMEKATGEAEKLRSELSKVTDEARKVIDMQAEEIKKLSAQSTTEREQSARLLASNETGLNRTATTQGQGDFVKRANQPAGLRPAGTAQAQSTKRSSGGIADIKFTLAEKPKPKDTAKSIKRYVPAGAYAQARIISGVDATAGVVAASDPRPVLLRVKKAAVTAEYEGEEQTIDIEGCTVTGAAHGDLSSEKVYVRLQTLTCSYEKSKVIEKPVKAYVAGNGKAGVRGIVVSREGDYITTALISSMIGGFGRGLNEAASMAGNPTTGGIVINQQNTQPSTGDIFQRGIGQGLSRGTDRIAEYLIRRAEQYQPVIVMGSGQDVEIVFLEGVELI